jgi:hypothetical protein
MTPTVYRLAVHTPRVVLIYAQILHIGDYLRAMPLILGYKLSCSHCAYERIVNKTRYLTDAANFLRNLHFLRCTRYMLYDLRLLDPGNVGVAFVLTGTPCKLGLAYIRRINVERATWWHHLACVG